MCLVGAFCDANGRVVSVVSWAASTMALAPDGATQLQLGINDWEFDNNSGSFTVQIEISQAQYQPWLLSVPQFSFHRSLVTDSGSFVIQNVSGDSLSRDMEKLLRASTFEGALFVYRYWQPDAEAAWIEVHGTLTVDDDGTDTITLKGKQLLDAGQDDTPLEIYSETCQLQWGGPRCGATGTTECSYSYQTCQSLNRIMVVMNNYEKNYGTSDANTALNVINRRRVI